MPQLKKCFSSFIKIEINSEQKLFKNQKKKKKKFYCRAHVIYSQARPSPNYVRNVKSCQTQLKNFP